MDQHALAVLKDAESWKWSQAKCIPESGDQSTKFKAITAQLLYWLIVESQELGGTVLDQFWLQLGECHLTLKENSEFYIV